MNPYQEAVAKSLAPPTRGITREFSLMKLNVREAFAYLASQLNSIGVTMRPGSRFDVYRNALPSADSTHDGHEERYSARERRALAEMQQLVFIVQELPQLNRQGYVPLLQRVVNGVPMPEDEPADKTSVRDFQFELLIAAACARSKFSTRLQEPPDVVVEATTKLPALGIAAKRVRNEKRIPERVKEGVRQIGASGMSGMVFVDCSPFLMRTELPTVHDSEQALQVVEACVQGVERRARSCVRDLTRGTNAFGVVYHGLLVLPHTMGGWLSTSHWWGDYGHVEKKCLLVTFMNDFECAPFSLVSGGFVQQRG